MALREERNESKYSQLPMLLISNDLKGQRGAYICIQRQDEYEVCLDCISL